MAEDEPHRAVRPADLAAAAALLAFAAPVTLQSDAPGGAGAGTVWDTVLLPAVVAPIFLRRRSPLLAAALVTAGCAVSALPTFEQFRLSAAIPAAMMVAFDVGRRTRRRQAVAGLLLVFAGMVILGATEAVLGDDGVAAMAAFSFPLCGGMWGAGRLVRSRDRLAAELMSRTQLVEQRRERTAVLAVEVERTRLGADVDASARQRLHRLVELAQEKPDGETFTQIERLGRESLNELRGLLGVLRSDERGARAPRPTLSELDALLEETRAGGRLVQLEVEGERRTLDDGVELAAYRTLQHGLVAVAGTDAEPARVRLRFAPSALDLEIRGPVAMGGGVAAAVAAARERVAAHGGHFREETDAACRIVRASFPLTRSDG